MWLLTSWPLSCSLFCVLWGHLEFCDTCSQQTWTLQNSELLSKPCWKWELWNKTHFIWRALLSGHGTKHVCANVVSHLDNFYYKPMHQLFCSLFPKYWDLFTYLFGKGVTLLPTKGGRAQTWFFSCWAKAWKSPVEKPQKTEVEKAVCPLSSGEVNNNDACLALHHVRAGTTPWA